MERLFDFNFYPLVTVYSVDLDDFIFETKNVGLGYIEVETYYLSGYYYLSHDVQEEYINFYLNKIQDQDNIIE